MLNADASTTAIHASPASSTVGQAVTFTATFTSSCAGTFTSHYFTIDGTVYHGAFTHGAFAKGGENGTETLSVATLKAGVHGVNYYWQMGGTRCRGVAYSHYTVAVAPSPGPTPTAAPPSPSASPAASPSPAANVTPSPGPSSPLVAYLGVALILVAVGSGVVLAVTSRR